MGLNKNNNSLNYAFIRLAKISCLLTWMISAFVLFGWILDISWLRNIFPNTVTMVVNTALAFILLSGALWIFISDEKLSTQKKFFMMISALLVIFLGMMTLFEIIFNWQTGVNTFIFKPTFQEVGSTAPGQMAPNTAINFILLGSALILFQSNKKQFIYFAQCLVLMAAIISFAALLGYIYNLEYLYRLSQLTRMSLYTAITFIIIVLGFLFSRVEVGPLAVISSARVSGKVARRLMTVIVILPLLLILINRNFQDAEYYHSSVGDMLLVMTIVIIFGSVIIYILTSSDRVERDFKLLFDLSVDMICIASYDGYFKKVNTAFSKTLGWNEEELLRHPYLHFVHQDDHAATIKANQDLVLGKKILSFDNRYLCKDGNYKWISWSAVPVMEESVILAVARDITPTKQAEAKLQNINLNLEKRIDEAEKVNLEMAAENKAKSDFLANMSHELRTPLNAILGFSNVLIRNMAGPVTEKQRELLIFIRNGGDHLLSLINDLLDLSKIEAGKVKFEISEFNLSHAINSIISLFKEKLLAHQLNISFDSAGDHLIKADERRIKQVILNLLSNAIKFTPPKGSISIIIQNLKNHQDDDSIQVVVQDTGIGISAEDQKRLFRTFEQLETGYEKRYAGTGLGLSLSKKIIEMHGGTIWVESDMGKGSRFCFIIPKIGSEKKDN